MRLCVSYLLTDWLCYCHLYSEWSLKTSAQRIKKATTFHRGRRLKCIVCTCPPHPVTEIRRYTVGVMKSSLEMECRHVITADHTRSVGNCRLTLSHCKQHVISAEIELIQLNTLPLLLAVRYDKLLHAVDRWYFVYYTITQRECGVAWQYCTRSTSDCNVLFLCTFYPRDALLAPYLLSSCVCLSVRLSVTRRYCVTSSSVVADKPARRAASRQTVKFYNSHVTIIASLLLVICRAVVFIDIAYSCTKFDDFRFSRSSDMIGAARPKLCSGSHDLTTPLSGTVCRP